MGGVAGQEHAPHAPAVRHQGMEAVAGLAPQAAFIGREPARQQAPGGFIGLHRFRVFTRQEHDFPAQVPAGAQQKGGGPRRLAELRIGFRQARASALVQQHVDHQPGLVEAQVVMRHADLPAHGRGGAVAADQVFGARLAGGARGVAQVDGDTRVVLRERDELATQRQFHRRQFAHLRPQYLLDGRLQEHHRGRPAHRIRRVDHGEPADQLAIHAVVLGSEERCKVRPHRLGHVEVLVDAQDLVVHGEGARLVVNVGEAVDDQYAVTHLAEHAGGRGARRPEAGDGDVVVLHFNVLAGALPRPVDQMRSSAAKPTLRCAALSSGVGPVAMPQWSMRPGGHFQSSGVPTR